jgi:hypothetical protein
MVPLPAKALSGEPPLEAQALRVSESPSTATVEILMDVLLLLLGVGGIRK